MNMHNVRAIAHSKPQWNTESGAVLPNIVVVIAIQYYSPENSRRKCSLKNNGEQNKNKPGLRLNPRKVNVKIH